MLDWTLIGWHALVFSVVALTIVISIMRIDNRIFVPTASLPEEVRARIVPFTQSEIRRNKMLNLIWRLWALGFPLFATFRFEAVSQPRPGFLPLFFHAFLVFISFWLVDLILIDGIILCWITPDWVVVPGTEGYSGYKDYGYHLRGHLRIGLLVVTLAGLLTAGMVWIL